MTEHCLPFFWLSMVRVAAVHCVLVCLRGLEMWNERIRSLQATKYPAQTDKQTSLTVCPFGFLLALDTSWRTYGIVYYNSSCRIIGQRIL